LFGHGIDIIDHSLFVHGEKSAGQVIHDLDETHLIAKGLSEYISCKLFHLVRNKIVPAAPVRLGMVYKNRANKTELPFINKMGFTVFAAAGLGQAPAGYVPFIKSGAVYLSTSNYLPTRR
jgi:hypothetical protein